ncbi:DUF456 domain-containing protein [Gordonia sp. TBRC 11910]|uniref:DUF456 domain-containing protein n=1 Tax=Gordonia asplenii TaxID=2725283 RepID=A0A848KZL2_9ACTN|nr:DUF456 domain-containing protein [Gordonia asplenii]NMO03597.1 DUF456 domain-containing protein [Gordonia asplenii]
MPFYGELLVALTICVGLVGIVLPVLPGTLLVAVAILVWAVVVGGWAWAVFAAAAVVLAAGEVVKYLVAGRGLKSAGVPSTTIIVGGVTGIVGFFVVPVVGLFLGFVLGAYASELVRHRTFSHAWQGAVAALKAVGTSMLIELLGALVASGIWLAAAFYF